MVNFVTIRKRLTPIAPAIPRWASAGRAEVLSILRKHGALLFATKPSQGDALHHCLGSGSDLIFKVSPATNDLSQS